MISGDNAAARGASGPFSELLRAFSRYWDGIDIVCPYVPKRLRRTSPYPNVCFYPLWPFRILAPLSIVVIGLALCRRRNYQLIAAHAFGPQLMSAGALLLSRMTGVPVVFEVHHIDGLPRAATISERIFRTTTIFFLRHAAPHARAFRVVNLTQAPAILRAAGVSQDKILHIPAIYLNHSVFKPLLDVVKRYDMAFVGRLASNKGLACMCDAFDCVRSVFPRARFVIVGSGPYEAWLRRRITRNRGITWLPRVATAGEMARVYNESRVVVCASLSEGGPRFTIEALACGVPVVSTPVGLMPELIRDGRNGFLLEDWRAESMAGRVLDILQSADYAHYARHAVQSVAHFDYHTGIARYARAYQGLIAA
jgi:glycosyltransferase involved in cell wall biosynthesis